MPIDIKPATLIASRNSPRLLGRAFADDPMFLWPFGPRPVEQITGFFRAFDERLAPRLALGGGAGAGSPAWIPPGSDAEMMEIDRESARPSPRQTRREEVRSDVGVDRRQLPGRARSGTSITSRWKRSIAAAVLGRRSSTTGSTFADRDGVPAFLETGRPGNVAYYERRGFRTTSDANIPGGGPHIWFMRYDP